MKSPTYQTHYTLRHYQTIPAVITQYCRCIEVCGQWFCRSALFWSGSARLVFRPVSSSDRYFDSAVIGRLFSHAATLLTQCEVVFLPEPWMPFCSTFLNVPCRFCSVQQWCWTGWEWSTTTLRFSFCSRLLVTEHLLKLSFSLQQNSSECLQLSGRRRTVEPVLIHIEQKPVALLCVNSLKGSASRHVRPGFVVEQQPVNIFKCNQ